MRRWWAAAAAGLGLAALLAAAPGPGAWLWQTLSPGSIAAAAEQLRALGPWAVAASLLLMVAQSVLAPLPGSLVAAANGVVFGIWWGALLSYLGGLLGAAATFWLARGLGRGFVAGRVPAAWLARVDELSEAHGFWVVLAARVTPVVSLDFIGYAAGLSGMSFRRYMLANLIGVAPGMWAYTVLGHDLAVARGSADRVGLILLGGAALFLLGRWWLGRRGAIR